MNACSGAGLFAERGYTDVPVADSARSAGEIANGPIEALARMLTAALKEAAVMIATAEDPANVRAVARISARQLISGLLRGA